jgi:hypothetical protein
VRALLAAALVALSSAVAVASGEEDEDTAVPGIQPASGLVLFYESSGPLSFPSTTPRGVPDGTRKISEVRGTACQRGVGIPTALSVNPTSFSFYFGDGGYAKALAKIKEANPEISGVYDVRTDLELFSILGIYKSLCTIVTARAFAPPISK